MEKVSYVENLVPTPPKASESAGTDDIALATALPKSHFGNEAETTTSSANRNNSKQTITVKFETYKSTPGLDRIPAAERYALYRATHKQLVHDDANYRRRYYRYLVAVVIVAVVPCSIWLGSSVLGIVTSILLSLIPVAGIVFLAFQQQRHMNRCIGSVLQSQLP